MTTGSAALAFFVLALALGTRLVFVCLLLCFAFLAPSLVLFASAECLKGPFFLSSLAPLLTFLREVFTTFLEDFFVGVERTTRVAARVACVARVALVVVDVLREVPPRRVIQLRRARDREPPNRLAAAAELNVDDAPHRARVLAAQRDR